VPTAEGVLFEVDTRLRPSGTQGPPAASFEAFARYQHEQAWTWEHMALCRARALYGSADARAELQEIVCDVLKAPRDAEKLLSDVLEMRATMAEHKPAKGPLDVKLARGGLVDLEFLVHFTQLRSGQGLTADLRGAIAALAQDGLLPETLVAAHDALTRFLVAARLLAPDVSELLPGPRAALARACACSDWETVQAGLLTARKNVASVWQSTFAQTLEVTA
jgi:glutamate-ammonia-ligase adenylyltransferase